MRFDGWLGALVVACALATVLYQAHTRRAGLQLRTGRPLNERVTTR